MTQIMVRYQTEDPYLEGYSSPEWTSKFDMSIAKVFTILLPSHEKLSLYPSRYTREDLDIYIECFKGAKDTVGVAYYRIYEELLERMKAEGLSEVWLSIEY